MRRDSALARLIYRLMERYTLPLLMKLGVTPSGLTLAGLGINALAAAAFVFSSVMAGLLIILAGLCDLLDGQMARANGEAGPQGAFLDSVLDRYGDAFLMIGAWVHLTRFPHYALTGTLIVFAALTGAMMVSYTRARGEGLGVSFRGGLFARPERVILMALAALTDPLAPGLVMFLAVLILAAGTNLTAVFRLFRIFRSLPKNGA